MQRKTLELYQKLTLKLEVEERLPTNGISPLTVRRKGVKEELFTMTMGSAEIPPQRPVHSRNSRASPGNEWRPIAGSSQTGTNSKGNQSFYSHTPSPRPPREEQIAQQERTSSTHQRSGDENMPSNERRSALERISQPAERILLLQDGVANSASGRLQEVDIQYLEDTLPLPLHQSGGSNILSSSKLPPQPSTGLCEGILDRSPIRTLSEDRLHVSLRLGPLLNSGSGSSKGSQRPNNDHEVSSPTGLSLGK
ncbi:hypothetical protein F2Q69_00033256 [Brassica cretica]|uniref:Uncharacterized protein n=1 Tax=Brassica cretica TaxID=69181 RepID=A0A8S9SNI2_BRACR|nr:hypothetical protein F2Q69_00033256 [Brassica cretica]